MNLILSLIILMSCSDQNEPVEQQILGKWEWISSVGGFAGTRITPATSNETQVIVFSKEKIARYKNDSLISEKPYHIEQGKTVFSNKDQDILVEGDDNSGIRLVLKVSGDTLELANNFVDGFGHTYVRSE